MLIRRLRIVRFRAISFLDLHPGPVTVMVGPSNAGKSSLLAAIDLLLHPGVGRPRALTELDYFGRDPEAGLEVEAVLGELPRDLVADAIDHIEGWSSATQEIVPDPDGPGIEAVLRVRVRGDADLQLAYAFAKEESGGARFPARLRRRIGWVYSSRVHDPSREFAFYQGSLLDRLFEGVDVDGPVGQLRDALSGGAEQINDTAAIDSVLTDLGSDLQRLMLLDAGTNPAFEAGPVSRRELLQAVRLAIPGPGQVAIPVERQGHGAQRMLLVATILRLAQSRHASLIAAFDEPEQALEPLRQTQVVEMLRQVVASGGQLFVSTHAPEIVRGFTLDDLVLVPDPDTVRPLAALPGPAKRHYERWLDGGVVRGLFATVPLLVEGPSDGPVLTVFWRHLAATGAVAPMANLGLELINCEGAEQQPPMANLLCDAGKAVVAWAEQDRPTTLERLRDGGHCAALLLHDPVPEAQNLEQSLASGTTLDALIAALTALAQDRAATWEEQRQDLLSRISDLPPSDKEAAKAATDVRGFVAALAEPVARTLIGAALGGKRGQHPPFEMKGARQGRLVAEAIVETAGVPESYRRGIQGLAAWIEAGQGPRPTEINMAKPPAAPSPPSVPGGAGGEVA